MENIINDKDFVMFCVFHKNFNDYFTSNHNFIYFGVNEIYEKNKNKNKNVILEYELDKYNPLLQKRGYMETSAYLHVYWNNLHKNKKMIGFCQYDMEHNDNYNELEIDKIYLLNANQYIVKNKEWNNSMFPNIRNLNFLIKSYNTFFKKNYSIHELENIPLSLWQTNIYPIQIYEKLCKWLEVLVEEIYPWSNETPYETHFGSIGGYTERALSIFNAFQIYEGTKYKNLNINHIDTFIFKEQYNKKSFLNNYSQDIHTKFIENITGQYKEVDFCMFKSQCFLNGLNYSCERIHKNGVNGLYFKREDWNNHKEYAFDIGGEDPRLIILNNKVYVVFTCEFNHNDIHRGIAITEFENYNPIFLKLKNNKFNNIEKNWAPFVKDNELYFIYNFDPLVILKYDYNSEGLCDVIFSQNNVELPINVTPKFLRGGSNLIHYKNEYFIGACHSRIHYNGIYYNTHFILLDTIKWKIIYLSKPIMYLYNNHNNDLNLNLIKNTNIINHKSILPHHSDKLHNLQAPCSIYLKNDKYFLTVDINCHITLLFELFIDIPLIDKMYNIDEIENLTSLYNTFFIDNQQ
jgi:hypothetical protein